MAGAGVAGILGRSSLGELLSKVVGHAISGTATGSVGAGNLTILLARASVAVIWSCLSDSQSGTLVLAVAWDRIVLAFNLWTRNKQTDVVLNLVGCENLPPEPEVGFGYYGLTGFGFPDAKFQISVFRFQILAVK